MSNTLPISLCIPTNGVAEWVFPVLESIYSQNVAFDKFEVIVTDNGDNIDFESRMIKYSSDKKNLIYKKTTAFQFLNQIEAFKMAKGEFIRFINHRMKMLPGTLNVLLDFVEKNKEDKPDIFFSNGALKKIENICYCSDFENYVINLSYYSSWSAGLGVWKSDFEKIVESVEYDTEFPHIGILFSNRDKKKYIIDNRVLQKELPVGTKSKGKYDFFYAFAVKYPTILLNLVHDKSISIETFLYLKKQTKKFIIEQYADFCIRKRSCSYDLSGYKKSIKVFYKNEWIKFSALGYLVKRKIVSLKKMKRKG